MQEYINNSFGTNFKIKKLSNIKGLPVFMSLHREFYEANDNKNSFVIIKIDTIDNSNIASIKKQYKQYLQHFNKQIVIYLSRISKTQRDILIKNKIPFIYENKQLYLPFLAISLQNEFSINKIINKEKMMPITQSLFLFLVYKCKDKRINKTEASISLNTTKTSITRACDQLLAMDLIEQEKVGKEYYIFLKRNSVDSFNKAKDYLINPIQETISVKKTKDLDKALLSGESALSQITMINDNYVKSLAIEKEKVKELTLVGADENWTEEKDAIRLQLWKYNPNLFANNKCVDPISLYLSLDNTDERIDDALNDMLEEYAW